MSDKTQGNIDEEFVEENANEELEEDTQVTEEKETSQLSSEFEKMTELTAQLENQLKRSLADYQNLQRRVQEEKSSWIRTANKELLLKLLPVLDTLMLAQKHLEDKGLGLSISHFLQVLSDEGVVKIETTGKEFDPMEMEAVTTQPSEIEKGKVLEEVRAGYRYFETVLRVAQVIVGE